MKFKPGDMAWWYVGYAFDPNYPNYRLTQSTLSPKEGMVISCFVENEDEKAVVLFTDGTQKKVFMDCLHTSKEKAYLFSGTRSIKA